MKKFENIILASDIDGTFIGRNGKAPARNVEKVKYFTENGGHFLFSSGRNSKDIQIVVDNIADIVNTPCVLVNGGMLYDVHADKIENPIYIDTEGLVEVFRDTGENFPDVGFRASYSGGFIVRNTDEYILSALRLQNLMQFATVEPLDGFYKYKFFKAVFYSSRERVAQLADYLIPKYEDRFGFTRSADVLLEIMPQGVTKARQLKFLKERFSKQYQNVELWCVGDFDNDIDMLRYADVAACPENATAAVKEICGVHLCHCSDGAVGELIDIIEEKQNKK
ncbi:MAG: HAD family phosphatase [Clostridia bacterium]|nr:HAD family phosphatase [Clostridia bacterium]MBO4428905.1 HAD family phosphatase [Clostridia bacterium]